MKRNVLNHYNVDVLYTDEHFPNFINIDMLQQLSFLSLVLCIINTRVLYTLAISPSQLLSLLQRP